MTRLDREGSETLWGALRGQGLLESTGKVTDDLRRALRDGVLPLAPELEPVRAQIEAILRRAAGRVEIKDRDDRQPIPLNKAVYLSDEFRELWDRIKGRTRYRVGFDNEILLRDCVKALRESQPIGRPRIQFLKTGVAVTQAGVEGKTLQTEAPTLLYEPGLPWPDILSRLEAATKLTRRSIGRIIAESERYRDFENNPQGFIERFVEVVGRCKAAAMVDGIKYERLGDESYAMTLFEGPELMGYLKDTAESPNGKSLFERVLVDSSVEREFVEALEQNSAVKLYAKLPSWFKIDTPMGKYNPDWAIVFEQDGKDRLYFVAETKAGLLPGDLRYTERDKTRCGKKHFESLAVRENAVRYEVVTCVDELALQAAELWG